MKTFEKFFNEEYDYNNVESTSRQYSSKLDTRNSYMTGITQPGGGNITFTPTECEEENKHKIKNKKLKQKKQRGNNDRNRTTNRSKHKIHIRW